MQPTTILVVDDTPSVRKVMTVILRRHGFVVVSAASGEEAVTRWHEHGGAIDLLISDVVMDEMSGFELIRTLRALRSDLAVLCTSGHERSALEEPLPAGVALMPKPFTPERLLAAVHAALGR